MFHGSFSRCFGRFREQAISKAFHLYIFWMWRVQRHQDNAHTHQTSTSLWIVNIEHWTLSKHCIKAIDRIQFSLLCLTDKPINERIFNSNLSKIKCIMHVVFMISIVYMRFHANLFFISCISYLKFRPFFIVRDVGVSVCFCNKPTFHSFIFHKIVSQRMVEKKMYDFYSIRLMQGALSWRLNKMSNTTVQCPIFVISLPSTDWRDVVMHFQFQWSPLMPRYPFKFSFCLNAYGDNVRHNLICLLIPSSTWWLHSIHRGRINQIVIKFASLFLELNFQYLLNKKNKYIFFLVGKTCACSS